MVFSSTIFLFLFLPVVLAIYAVLPRGLRNAWLLLASLFFYTWGEQAFALVMLASITMNYLFGLLVANGREERSRRIALGAGIAANLCLLGTFKYANFLVDNLNLFLARLNLGAIEIEPVHLPIGISFFTFQAMSYVVDVWRGAASPQRNPLNLALYISLFPQLIAGPIVRYKDIAEQITRRSVNLDDFAVGVRRFLIGLGKKVLIANTLALPADQIFAIPGESLTAPVAWLGVVCYGLQIYFDFSGYSDMAIGLGRMFGFRFMENFNYPYISRSIQEFWRRWHISLSTWFRDYLYIPLGGNRTSAVRTYVNLGLDFLLCGLWHGASWNFVIWGLIHGAFLVIERVSGARWLDRVPGPVRSGYTIGVVFVAWVFFRAETFPEAMRFLGAMAGLGAGSGMEYHLALYLEPAVVIALVAGIVGATPILPAFARWRGRVLERTESGLAASVFAMARTGALVLLMLACAMQLAAGTYNPFIYFRF